MFIYQNILNLFKNIQSGEQLLNHRPLPLTRPQFSITETLLPMGAVKNAGLPLNLAPVCGNGLYPRGAGPATRTLLVPSYRNSIPGKDSGAMWSTLPLPSSHV